MRRETSISDRLDSPLRLVVSLTKANRLRGRDMPNSEYVETMHDLPFRSHAGGRDEASRALGLESKIA
jgi:hypothetical protein